ncbi:MAG: DUF2062 domain-containing protein [Pseudomonadota bacterium]
MTKQMVLREKNNIWQSFERLLRYRLIVPLMRSKHPPEHAARGVMVGVVWAMTPFFGIQMLLALLTWLISTRVLKWDFSLINAIAWTWVTNIFTLIPFFYAFYVTGQLMLGDFSNAGYEKFQAVFSQMLSNGSVWSWEGMQIVLNFLISDIGGPMTLGSVVWAVVCGIVAYYLSLRFVVRYRENRFVNFEKHETDEMDK